MHFWFIGMRSYCALLLIRILRVECGQLKRGGRINFSYAKQFMLAFGYFFGWVNGDWGGGLGKGEKDHLEFV